MGLTTEPVNLSVPLENADWPKGSLDLVGPDGKPVHDEASLMAALDADGATLEDFKALPAYSLAIDSGRYPWLASL